VLVGVLVAVFMLLPRPVDAAEYEAEVADSLADVMDIPDEIFTAMMDASPAHFDDGIGSESIAVFQDTAARSSSAIESAKADLEDMVPPRQYEREHDDLLASLDQLLAVTGSLSEMVEGLQPEDTVSEITSEYEDQFYREMRDGARAYADMRSALGELGLDDLLPEVIEDWEF